MRKSLIVKNKKALKTLIDILSINYDGFQPDIQVELNDESYTVDKYNDYHKYTNLEMKIVINTLQNCDDEE